MRKEASIATLAVAIVRTSVADPDSIILAWIRSLIGQRPINLLTYATEVNKSL